VRMATTHKTSAFRDLDRLFRLGIVPAGDRALLHSFLSGGDEAAFEALVTRHGPMVLGVCRRLLASPHDADDAFQATFLVLVRKAGRLRDADRLGPWLHGVATRVASKARVRSARHRPEPLLHDVPAREESPSDMLDVRPILDSELGRLSAKYRDVLVLCLLEGATAEEAALRLACPVGTVKSRLARGREALRARLMGRGLAPAVALAAVSSTFASPVSAALTRTTLAAIATAPAALAPSVVALTRGVAPIMLPKSTLMASVMIGGVALAGLGLSPWLRSQAVAQEGAQVPADVNLTPPAVDHARFKAKHGQSVNHLRQIMLALHSYAAANNHFPPAAIYGKDGQPLLSWRVAILPYMEQAKLYEEFHKDEPWDSPHNKALWRRMPAVFTTPHSPVADHATRIQGFQGEAAYFEGRTGLPMSDFTDGTSNTLALTLSDVATVWTRPGDLPFVDGAPIPALDTSDPQGYLIALADGSVRSLAKDAKGMPRLLSFMITRNGGEVIEIPPTQPATSRRLPSPEAVDPTLVVTPHLRGRGEMSSGGVSGSGMERSALTPSVEQRLQSLEEKLDRVLKKLDAMSSAPTGDGAAPKP